MDGGWISVRNSKKERRRKRFQERLKEEERWSLLQKECPHIVTPTRARKLYKKLNIDKLDVMLLSDEWISYQKQGWKYIKTLKSRDSKIPQLERRPGYEYSTLELNNGWGDLVLFCKVTEVSD